MNKHAYVVTDIGYGDAGKGTVVDYLTRQSRSTVVVRHNGGPQAAHNVVTSDGRHHTFAQFGSGSFVPDARTHLSRFMLVNPLNMIREAEHLIALGVTDIWRRTTVDEDALIILPWHQSANRLRELARGGGRHGSCGQGVGEAQADHLSHPSMSIHARDLRDINSLAERLRQIRDDKYRRLRYEITLPDTPAMEQEWGVFTDPNLIPWLCEEYRYWCRIIDIVPDTYLNVLARNTEQLIFEGAQGVLLDEWYGFHPYTTWSTTTPVNALTLLSELDEAIPVTKLGVMRAYTTRHGPGPFVTEDRGLAGPLREYHNGMGEWQGAFRYGHLDLMAHRYAIAACGGIDELVVTGIDRLAPLNDWYVCSEYRLKEPASDLDRYFERSAGRLTGIKLGPFADLKYQARLTQLLMSMSPVYQYVTNTPNQAVRETELLERIETILDLPITLVSTGPTAEDKRVRTFVNA